MKLIDFHIVEAYAISAGNVFLDLHNEYQFEGTVVDLTTSTVWITWNISPESRQLSPPARVVVEVVQATNVRVSRGASGSASDSKTTRFIGFLHPDQGDVMNGCLDEHEADEAFDLIIGFEDESAIKVSGGTARLLLL